MLLSNQFIVIVWFVVYAQVVMLDKDQEFIPYFMNQLDIISDEKLIFIDVQLMISFCRLVIFGILMMLIQVV